MIYEIPEANLTKLQKKAEQLKKKGANIKFDILETIYKKDNYINYKYYKIDTEGVYIINDWQYIGSLEHLPEGNLIKLITKVDIPDKYKTCGPICEHCNKQIDRTKTYLVQNIKTKEFKQIGKTCLKNYTGLDIEHCALHLSFLDTLNNQLNFPIDSIKYYENDIYKKYAYEYIKANGYDKLNIVSRVEEFIENNKNIQVDLTDINKYIETLDTNSSTYFWNAKIAWNLDYIKNENKKLIYSIIYLYFKHLTEIKNTVETYYVGNIGDLIDINIKSFRVLYKTDNGQFNYYMQSGTCYEIIDENNNYYIWTTTKQLTEDVKHIKAKVKGYKEFRGIKQTVITRGKCE